MIPGCTNVGITPSSATTADLGSEIAGGATARRRPGWSPIFLSATGSGSGLLFLTQIATEPVANRFRTRPQCPAAAATVGQAAQKGRFDDNK